MRVEITSSNEKIIREIATEEKDLSFKDLTNQFIEKGISADFATQRKLFDRSRPIVDYPQETLVHKYALRQDFEVWIELPVDLTAKEAMRLSDMMKTLCFEKINEFLRTSD